MSSTDPQLEWREALFLLGLEAGDSEEDARRNYRRLLHRTHPDRSSASDATERTVRLTAAYEVVLRHLRVAAEERADRDRRRSTTGSPEEAGPVMPVGVELIDGETIAIGAPALEVIPMLIEAAHQLGEISYLDPVVGLLEVIVEFVGAPTSSVVLTLQGRANGTTEVFCGVEPLSGGDAPDAAAVAQLLVRTLKGEDPTT